MTEAMVGTRNSGVALCPEQQRRVRSLASARTFGEAVHEVMLEIHGELDLARLQRAVSELPNLHPVLAARLRQLQGFHGLRFCEGAGATPALGVEPTVLPAQALERRLEAWRGRAFSMEQEPWVDALLLQRDENLWLLTLAIPCCLVDSFGLALIVDGLASLYARAGTALPAEAPRVEQYLEWRAETAMDEDAETAAHYWRSYMHKNADLPGQLPYRLGEPEGLRAERAQLALTPLLRAGLQRQAAEMEVTPTQLLQAAWWALLSRISEHSAFLAHWTHDSREDYEYFASCAGVFEKALPLQVSIDPAQAFGHWAKALAAVQEQHIVWQEYWTAPQGAHPAFGFATLRDTPESIAASQGWIAVRAPQQCLAYELLLQVRLSAAGECSELLLDFLPECYSASSVERLLGHYLASLHALIADPMTAIGEINLVDEAEQVRLLALNPPAESEAPRLLMQQVRHWVACRPEHDAVVCADERLTYATLDLRVRALAAALARHGLSEGSVAAIALSRSSDWVVAALATWWIGAAYVAVDPQWPVSRQLERIAQADAHLVIGRQATCAALSGQGLPLVDPRSCSGMSPSECPPAHPWQRHEAAYVLFTSGSTGMPKGVVIEHRHLANYLSGASEVMGLQTCSQFAVTSTVAADLGYTTLFGGLYSGGCLHIADEDILRRPDRFAAYLEEEAVDCLKIVPSHLAALLETEHPRLPATLILGGEPPAPRLIARIFEIRPDCRLYNHYGPTEATVGVMVQALTPPVGEQARIALDTVLPGNQVYVLDSRLRLVPPGALGELYIGGQQVCRGYLQADREGDVFVDSPFVLGERLYRTGDLARYRPQGGLYLQGRKDQQFKVNGFRVEPGEIEAELLRQAFIKEAAVLAVPVDADPGVMQPVAFVVVREGEADPLLAIRSELASRLPSALVPRRIHVMEGLPRLANGKIDRQALAMLGAPEEHEVCDPPRDAFEALLVARMSRLLGKETLGIHQDFFAAGGHSLLAIKLVAGIRKVLRCEISPGVVFDHPTVASLTQALRELPGTDPQQMEATARAYLQLETLSPEQRAVLEEKARQLRETHV
ncbi:amino acid adenylation domain-containing protein [Pseudomonas capeferrum]|uniref:non-ribosomal peptide synthetase n=1 Tax=Pseudomonas capeferrum TaxID=1495066 RepID=UPI0015E4612E|nr:amino acid adenylation domain-containing protein [Pseudomonas capeferrum]MBA1200985.1 amino acid adenylation domain-containing protein [Pseudomonas capeferrum]